MSTSTVGPDYASTAALLGAVIAMSGTEIARARSRVRPDRDRLTGLENHRAEAVRILRGLDGHEPSAVAEAWAKFSAVYLALRDGQPI